MPWFDRRVTRDLDAAPRLGAVLRVGALRAVVRVAALWVEVFRATDLRRTVLRRALAAVFFLRAGDGFAARLRPGLFAVRDADRVLRRVARLLAAVRRLRPVPVPPVRFEPDLPVRRRAITSLQRCIQCLLAR
jgi:hypothetical protein